MGQHPIVCRLLQGMFNERPPQPRYQYVWDVGDIVEFLKSMAPNEALSYKDLTMKLATIMAITNADRASNQDGSSKHFYVHRPVIEPGESGFSSNICAPKYKFVVFSLYKQHNAQMALGKLSLNQWSAVQDVKSTTIPGMNTDVYWCM